MKVNLNLVISILITASVSLSGQEQLTFSNSSYGGLKDVDFHEVNGKFRFVTRHLNGDVAIMELNADESIDTLYKNNFTTHSLPIFSQGAGDFYIEIYNEKIVRLKLSTLEETILDTLFSAPLHSIEFNKNMLYFSDPQFEDVSQYLLNDSDTVQSINHEIANLIHLKNQTYLNSIEIEEDLYELYHVDFLLEEFELIDTLHNPKFLYDVSPIILTDEMNRYLRFDESEKEFIPFYEVSDSSLFRRVVWRNNQLFVGNMKDSIETIVVFNENYEQVKTFSFKQPKNNATFLHQIVPINQDTLVVDYFNKIGLIASSVDTFTTIFDSFESHNVMANDSLMAFIVDDVLYTISINSESFKLIERDSLDYTNFYSYNYILTDSVCFINGFNSLYVSHGTNKKLKPIDTAEGNEYRRDWTGTLIKTLNHVAIIKSDSLFILEDDVFINHSQNKLRSSIGTSKNRSVFAEKTDGPVGSSKLIELTKNGEDIFRKEVDLPEAHWRVINSPDRNYIVLQGQGQLYTWHDSQSFPTLKNDFPINGSIQNIFFENTMILKGYNNGIDSIFSYDFNNDTYSKLGPTDDIELINTDSGSWVISLYDEQSDFYYYDNNSKIITSKSFGIPNDWKYQNSYPCNDKILAEFHLPDSTSILVFLQPNSNQYIEVQSFNNECLPILINTVNNLIVINVRYGWDDFDIYKLSCITESLEIVAEGVDYYYINLFRINNKLFGHQGFDVKLVMIDKEFESTHIANYPNQLLTVDHYETKSIYEQIPFKFPDYTIVNMAPSIFGQELYKLYQDGTYELLFDLNPGPFSGEIFEFSLWTEVAKNMIYHNGYLYFTGTPEKSGRHVFRYPLENVISSDNIEIVLEDNDFVLYPNPTSNQIHFKHHGNEQSNWKYNITNSNGQIVLQGITNKNKLNVSGLSNGFYFLNINLEGIWKNYKFIKQDY